jgi:hypothetical protein
MAAAAAAAVLFKNSLRLSPLSGLARLIAVPLQAIKFRAAFSMPVKTYHESLYGVKSTHYASRPQKHHLSTAKCVMRRFDPIFRFHAATISSALDKCQEIRWLSPVCPPLLGPRQVEGKVISAGLTPFPIGAILFSKLTQEEPLLEAPGLVPPPAKPGAATKI